MKPHIGSVISILLHKGHDKDPSSGTSYHTISKCTIIVKVLDANIASIHAPTKGQHSMLGVQLTYPLHPSKNTLPRAINTCLHTYYIVNKPDYWDIALMAYD